MTNLIWHDFKSDPPYDYKSTSIQEDDPDNCMFTYKHTNWKQEFLILAGPCLWIDDCFKGYESHMKTSPYPEDKIEIVSWCYFKDIKSFIKDTIPVCNKEKLIL